jgi:hypothetical protein
MGTEGALRHRISVLLEWKHGARHGGWGIPPTADTMVKTLSEGKSMV